MLLDANQIFPILSTVNPLKYSRLNYVGDNEHGREFFKVSQVKMRQFSDISCWPSLGQHASQCVRRASGEVRILGNCSNQPRW